MTDSCVAIILGIVEGITEFIPVSSTGHLLIAEQWLPAQTDLFNVVIQCGAVLAVIPLFRERFRQFTFGLSDPGARDYLLKILAAFVITGIGGYALEKAGFKLPEKLFPVAIALLIGGILFVIVEGWLARHGGKTRTGRAGAIIFGLALLALAGGIGVYRVLGTAKSAVAVLVLVIGAVLALRETRREPVDPALTITWTVAAAVAIGQLIAAAFPGSSRSGTTILFALILGLNRPLATEFSFLVGIPTMLAAGAYKILKAVHQPDPSVHENWKMVIIASIVAALVSFVAVRWLLRYVQTHTFVAFGWYRVVLAVLILAMLHLR
jgi:undecaprenyl-diphosphatase